MGSLESVVIAMRIPERATNFRLDRKKHETKRKEKIKK